MNNVTASVVVVAAAFIAAAGTAGLLPDLAILAGLEGCAMFFLFKLLTSNATKPWTRRGGLKVLAGFVATGAVIGAATGAGAWWSMRSKAERQEPVSVLREKALNFATDRVQRNTDYQGQMRRMEDSLQSQSAGLSVSGKEQRRIEFEREQRSHTDAYVETFVSRDAPQALSLMEKMSNRLRLFGKTVPKEGRKNATRVFQGKEANPDSILEAAKYLKSIAEELP